MTTLTIDQLPSYTGDPASAYTLVRYGGVSYKLLVSSLPSGSSYTHPASHPPSIIDQDSGNRFVTDTEKSTWNAKQPAGDYATGGGTATGTNTGDQVIPTTLPASDVYPWAKAATKPTYTATEVGLGNVPNLAFSGSNTGDETTATIKSKLGITTLSGSNTGDQVIPTTLPASDVYAWAKAATKPSYTATEVGLGNVPNLAFSGSNTGDNAANTTYAADYRAANFVAGTNYLAPNGSAAALTGLTPTQVTTALGYTPSNPAGMSVSVIGTNTTATTGGTYVLTASLTLTLPASPAAGNTVAIANRSGVTTCVVARNAQPIMGLAEDMTLDIAASITLVYADATRGWVIL